MVGLFHQGPLGPVGIHLLEQRTLQSVGSGRGWHRAQKQEAAWGWRADPDGEGTQAAVVPAEWAETSPLELARNLPSGILGRGVSWEVSHWRYCHKTAQAGASGCRGPGVFTACQS